MSLDTSSDNPIEDFFNPALMRAVSYDVGVGYFTSGWIALAAKGIALLIANGGHSRWIINPDLPAEDWEAIKRGTEIECSELINKKIMSEVQLLETELGSDTRNVISWLIFEGKLEFKIAIPIRHLSGGIWHPKFGVISDSCNNSVAFDGSYNMTAHANLNWEKINLYRSWVPDDATRLNKQKIDFARIWGRRDGNLRVFDVKNRVLNHIINNWRGERPSLFPPPAPVLSTQPKTNELYTHDDLATEEFEDKSPGYPGDICLRDYQAIAMRKWFDAGRRGTLAMATGTGKTIMALGTCLKLLDEGPLLVIVCCPYQHLVDQWSENLDSFCFRNMRVHSGVLGYKQSFINSLRDLKIGALDHLVIVTTYDSFLETVSPNISDLCGINTVFIGDEAHHAGALKFRNHLPNQILWRMALSATPSRHLDDEGSNAIFEYFGPIIYEITLAAAINELKVLCPYRYIPIIVDLTEDELGSYRGLCKKIAKFIPEDREISESDLYELPDLKTLYEKRVSLIDNAYKKLLVLDAMLDKPATVRKTLFYCSPQLITPVSEVLAAKGIVHSRFTHIEDSQERKRVLQNLDTGLIQGVIAIRCLDEGVDLPSIQTAWVLCSSSNPKEWVQRRGRILRKSEGKTSATIYDFLVIPSLNPNIAELTESEFSIERQFLMRELTRFAEFAGSSLNRWEAVNSISAIAKKYNLEHLA